ncbi:hypothetical protein CFIICLFH_0247 [Methylobacterium goesingense]|nr:hypothetical protein CFIICLFH_0247 [Methylobacterium goesingense]
MMVARKGTASDPADRPVHASGSDSDIANVELLNGDFTFGRGNLRA